MININLLPPQSKATIKQAKKSASVFGVCLVVLIFFVVVEGILMWTNKNMLIPDWQAANKKILNESAKAENYKEVEKQAIFITNRSTIAKQLEPKRALWSYILTNLISTMPNDVQIESLTTNLERSPNCAIQGNTVSEAEIVKFKDKLEESPYFKDVFFRTSSTDTQGTTDKKVKFTIDFNIENIGKPKEAK